MSTSAPTACHMAFNMQQAEGELLDRLLSAPCWKKKDMAKCKQSLTFHAETDVAVTDGQYGRRGSAQQEADVSAPGLAGAYVESVDALHV